MSRKIAILVCNNGLGHLKRVLWIIDLLQEKLNAQFDMEVFVDCTKLDYFYNKVKALKKRNGCSVSFFDIKANVTDYEQWFMAKFKDKLHMADFIWSDNLIFPLKYKDDVFLTGSFLWPEVLAQTNERCQQEKELLNNKQPVIIANKYFATPMVRSLTNIYEVGLYEYFNGVSYFTSNNGILFSGGNSKFTNFKNHIEVICKKLEFLPAEIDIYVDAEYYSDLAYINRLRKASFDEAMFSRIACAVIRPGLGTICDVLLKRGRIFPINEDDNFEMRHNSYVINELNLGECCKDIGDAFNKAASYIKNEKARRDHFSRVSLLEFNGLSASAQKISDILNN